LTYSLAVDILLVAAFDSDPFDATFSELVAPNAEGRIIGSQRTGGVPDVPFTSEVIERLSGSVQPV
jgi:hypothetical protein